MHTLRQYARANRVCGTRCLGFVKSADEKMWPRRKKNEHEVISVDVGACVCVWAFARGWRGKLCSNEMGKVGVNSAIAENNNCNLAQTQQII